MKLDVKKQFSSRTDRVKGIDFHPTEPWVLTTLYSGRVEIWSYETGIKSIDVADVPVRSGRFIARKNWIVVGSDDFQVRVYNYNTSEKIAQFEAHPDYIRSIAVHPTRPFVLTSSDDATIKLWNWDNSWKLEQTFEGHQHYVMSLAFNPKDPNTFASACLDHTVKIWSLGNSQPNFTLVAHEQKGVNYVSYYPQSDKPYLLTASDDRTIKVWDYQTKSAVATLEGHSSNVSFAIYHQELPLIISGSEDATIKIWNANTYKLEKTLNYGLERAWCISSHKNSNSVAIGYDAGFGVLAFGNDEPRISMDPVGKLIWSKNNEVYSSVIKGNEQVEDGETLPLSSKDLGSVEIFPSSLKHSPNGRFVTVTGDGEFIIYTALAWRNKEYGSALDFVWAQDPNIYAIRDSSNEITIWKNFKVKSNGPIDFPYEVEKLYGGSLLGIKSDGFVAFYDWESQELVRRIDVDATDIVWSESGELVLIISNEASFALRFDRDVFVEALEQGSIDPEDGVEDSFEVLYDVNETITSGKWVGDVFIFTTSTNRLNYLVGGKTYNIAHFDKNAYLLGYLARDNKVYVTDKDINITSYHLSLPVLEYQTLVLRGELEQANQDLLPNIESTDLLKISRFLEAQEYLEEALEISPDSEQKFEIAIKIKDFETAKSIANSENTEHKWKSLGDLALNSFKYKLAIESFEKANDIESLLLLYTSFNNKTKLLELAEEAQKRGKYNVAFNAYWTTGNIEKAIELLNINNKFTEASFFGLTYGGNIEKSVENWKNQLEKLGKGFIAERITVPNQIQQEPESKQQDLVDLNDEKPEESVEQEQEQTQEAEPVEQVEAEVEAEDESFQDAESE
ncbi:Coatomer subunit beta [Wickerhamomyces ciferrii]|uniref:Coatomer subunit beta' n=1 Tax=Wickerhamomyces ciferrii (strain ATCC 14091 / BCRC 22168 / CBS 111 / JCM 3599 / NBRC 0793 / NRRL Y-1031 F-60-10) TaxID=1206466 RepID=K0KR94_WICCF|nr:Coatomer subunit beta [Wickerhamomyces ciferrii]CCH45676.1 Coatomer subunit beta [Wickerhamomyces ciferrii]